MQISSINSQQRRTVTSAVAELSDRTTMAWIKVHHMDTSAAGRLNTETQNQILNHNRKGSSTIEKKKTAILLEYINFL